ncbi:unnamed protein product [Amoebophrya sp. A120]|nr:unnamed protein product [Amoebophrya sp. A120]|eukprot:GSA120T00007980001.1
MIGERFFGQDLVRDMTREMVDAVHKKTAQQMGLKMDGSEEQISFENFLSFVHLFTKNMQDAHPWRGYANTFALKVQGAMKERGAQPVSSISELSEKNPEANEDSDDDADFDKVAELSKSRAMQRAARKDGSEIAVKTSALFKVLKDLGVDTNENQKWLLREMQKIDADETGWFTADQMLSLFREMDAYWESTERRQQVAIIDETGYLERDVDNLKAIFNEYAKVEGESKPQLGVAEFREFFRALQMTLQKKETARLKDMMHQCAREGNDTDRIDFPAFCLCMKKLEAEDFCGLKSIMGRKDEVETDLSIATRQLSYFERKAQTTRARGSPAK